MVHRKVSLIVACTIDGGIAYDTVIPWYISEDLHKFKQITTRCSDPAKQNAVIMGRNTWESIGRKLPNRLNIVVTSDYDYYINDKSVIIAHSIMSALAYCDQPHIENIFIIGGTSLYNEFLHSDAYLNAVDRIYLSVMFYDSTYNVNKFFDIHNIFKHFYLIKDVAYHNEAKRRLFASYICFRKPPASKKHLTQKCFNIDRVSASLCQM